MIMTRFGEEQRQGLLFERYSGFASKNGSSFARITYNNFYHTRLFVVSLKFNRRFPLLSSSVFHVTIDVLFSTTDNNHRNKTQALRSSRQQTFVVVIQSPPEAAAAVAVAAAAVTASHKH